MVGAGGAGEDAEEEEEEDRVEMILLLFLVQVRIRLLLVVVAIVDRAALERDGSGRTLLWFGTKKRKKIPSQLDSESNGPNSKRSDTTVSSSISSRTSTIAR